MMMNDDDDDDDDGYDDDDDDDDGKWTVDEVKEKRRDDRMVEMTLDEMKQDELKGDKRRQQAHKYQGRQKTETKAEGDRIAKMRDRKRERKGEDQ